MDDRIFYIETGSTADKDPPQKGSPQRQHERLTLSLQETIRLWCVTGSWEAQPGAH